jgi:SAM-dependent methyltransferase
MPTAFGRAMLDTIGGNAQQFRMSMQGGPSITMNCCDFMTLRHEERSLLNSIDLPAKGNVLDYGCGTGRHLTYMRNRDATLNCFGIEICELMRDYCRQTIAVPATFVRAFDELPERQHDLIMLMGNGLGVFGEEQVAARSLQSLIRSLHPKGRMVIETGNPFGYGYFVASFTIDYQEHHDARFLWGYSDRDWLSRTLNGFGCDVAFLESHAPGGKFFFAVAQRR